MTAENPHAAPPITPTPQRPAPVFVPDSVLDRLAKVTSGSLTTQLYIKGFRQPVLPGLRPLGSKIKPFAGLRGLPRAHGLGHPGAISSPGRPACRLRQGAVDGFPPG